MQIALGVVQPWIWLLIERVSPRRKELNWEYLISRDSKWESQAAEIKVDSTDKVFYSAFRLQFIRSAKFFFISRRISFSSLKFFMRYHFCSVSHCGSSVLPTQWLNFVEKLLRYFLTQLCSKSCYLKLLKSKITFIYYVEKSSIITLPWQMLVHHTNDKLIMH